MDDNTAVSSHDLFFLHDLNHSPPIERNHLHGELLRRLRDLIVNGEIAPSAKVPERELCDMFGVSRTPLREALKVLAHEGLIVLHHNRGATVSPLTLREVEEVFPVYARLDALAGKLASSRLTEVEIADLRVLHRKLKMLYKQRDLKAYFEINEAIHERIQLGAHNHSLMQFLHYVTSRVRRARLRAARAENRWATAVAEHEQIMAAIEERDGQQLSILLHEHAWKTFESLKKSLSNGEMLKTA
jgi:DNA-binding GntR family transcriptional regulator